MANRDDSAIVKKAWITRRKNKPSKTKQAAGAWAAAKSAGVKKRPSSKVAGTVERFTVKAKKGSPVGKDDARRAKSLARSRSRSAKLQAAVDSRRADSARRQEALKGISDSDLKRKLRNAGSRRRAAQKGIAAKKPGTRGAEMKRDVEANLQEQRIRKEMERRRASKAQPMNRRQKNVAKKITGRQTETARRSKLGRKLRTSPNSRRVDAAVSDQIGRQKATVSHRAKTVKKAGKAATPQRKASAPARTAAKRASRKAAPKGLKPIKGQTPAQRKEQDRVDSKMERIMRMEAKRKRKK